MHYLQNHIWCSSCNWDEEHYDCRHLVSIDNFGDDKDDWSIIIDDEAESTFDHKGKKRFLDSLSRSGTPYDKNMDNIFKQFAPNLKPHVLKWLNDNVKDRDKKHGITKGWCIGSANYRQLDCNGFSVFFHRKNDALAFIRKFSMYKKPTIYCQYFSDVRKKLNLETMKYEKY